LKKRLTYIISDIDKALAFEWMATALSGDKYQQDYLLLNPGDSALEQFLKKHGIPVQRIRCTGKKDWLYALWRIFRHLKQAKPDIVHCHLQQANIIGLTAAKIAGVKKRIYTRHHSDYHHRYYPKGVWLDRYCNTLATHIIAPSEVVKEVLCEREQVPARKVSVIPHGFDMDYFRQTDKISVDALREKYQLNDHWPVIGVISRFTELKGIQYIIPAFQKILQSYPGALLMLLNARGDYEAQIHRQLNLLPPESYRTIPFEQDLSAAYRLFDVFVQVSTERMIESFGQTYVEALAAGTPAVFTLAGIAGEFIVHEQNALVVPFRDTDAIYHAVTRIINDESLRNRLKEEGWHAVSERFSFKKMADELERVYAS